VARLYLEQQAGRVHLPVLPREANMTTGIRRGTSSLAMIAETMREDIATGVPESDSVRLLFGFADEFRGSDQAGKAALIADEPAPTGDRKFDAALAGEAEYFADEADLAPPVWVNGVGRFAEPWFFVAGMPAMHAYVLARTPVAFKRHGVFMAREVFDRA
jgi:hypothetical protein